MPLRCQGGFKHLVKHLFSSLLGKFLARTSCAELIILAGALPIASWGRTGGGLGEVWGKLREREEAHAMGHELVDYGAQLRHLRRAPAEGAIPARFKHCSLHYVLTRCVRHSLF